LSEPATLLVADDDPGLRESLERTLSREGYRVVLASDGRAALERFQSGGIDLIVTDLKMPGLTGLELLRAAKTIAPDVDVILLTAFGTVEEAVKAMKDGAYDFLTKPFRREQLIKLIEIYARSFPGPGGRWQVSESGGVHPHWTLDGRAAYYWSNAGLARRELREIGNALEPGRLSTFPSDRPILLTEDSGYAVGANGRVLVFPFAAEGRVKPRTTLVLGWRTELERKLKGPA